MQANGHPAKRSRLGSHSFYVRILTIFISLLLLTVLPIITYNYYKNKRIVLDLSDDLMDHVCSMVIGKASNYFIPASVMVEMSSKLIKLGVVSFDDKNEVEMYTLGVLKYYPQVSMFFLADEQGTYIRGWRLPDGTMETRVIMPNASPPRDLFKYFNADFELFDTQEARSVDYDPRVRPWYIGAKETRSNFWTGVYILFRNKKPAITTSYPVFDEKGNIIGVWAMDIELDAISGFLKTLKVGKSGLAFIINEKVEVVAHPDESLIIKEENGRLRPVLMRELGIEAVDAGFLEHVATGRSKTVVEVGGRKYFASFSDFPSTFPVPWKIVVVVPEDDFTSGAKQLMKESLIICSIILIISIFLAALVSRDITRPIKLLAAETRKIRDFHLEGKITITSYIKEIQFMSDAISAMKTGLKAFRRYVPAELVRQLVHTGEEARLGGHKKELTVFFSDIAGFTSIAERVSPEELMLHLSEYFDELTKILTMHRATVDKYIGDAILAFWGAPVHDDDHAFHACSAALACGEKIAELNRNWQAQGKAPLMTRIGISTGESIVGNVGSSERINYTVMGDTVNLASRLEGANKFYRTGIIVSHSTYEAVSDKFLFRLLGDVAAKGKSIKTTIYELVGGKPEEQSAETVELCGEFTRGVEAYLDQDWGAACGIFARLAAKFPHDGPSHFYLARCEHFMDNAPGPDWRGVEYLESK
ncbi:MAG: adenylate/guanylate cyclase domain-containing protein [Syntrophobacteraceae bacterium]